MVEYVEVEALADPHTHLRELSLHAALIKLAMEGGADVLGAMPNTKDGLRTPDQAEDYRLNAENTPLPPSGVRRPRILPFLMITEDTTFQTIDKCVSLGIYDGKVYPRWRTTQSQHGVERYGLLLPKIAYCGRVGMRVHLHPEHPNSYFLNRDAEFVFLPIARIFLEETGAVIFWEHGTDARCIPHWEDMAKSGRFFVTLTAHHLVANEDNTFGDVRAVCKPTIKTELDRRALVGFVSKGYPWVMAGGDSAVHPEGAKHVGQGQCACGAFTSPFLLPLYAHALGHLLRTEAGREIFVNFASRNARRVLGLPEASRAIRLEQQPWQIPLTYQVGPEVAMPFWAKQTIDWSIVQ